MIDQIIAKEKSSVDTETAYADPTWFYDIRGFFILTFAYNDTLWRQIKFFTGTMSQNHLEIAVGSGTLLKLILRWRKIRSMPESEIIATDYVPSMLRGATRALAGYPNLKKIMVADARQLPFSSEAFDSVHIANSLHSIVDVDSALKETYRVLKPGGVFASNTLLFPDTTTFWGRIAHKINTWGIRKGILVTPYTQEDIVRRIRDAGFSIVETAVHGNACYVEAVRS